jgi:hypothetical protein
VTVEIVVSESPEPPKPKSVKRVEQEKRDGDRKTKTKASKKKKAASADDVSFGVSSGIASSSIDDLSDVNTTGAADGDALVFDGTNWVDVPYLLATLGDTNITSPATDATITWDGTDWVDTVPTLAWLDDVDLTGAADGDVLTYDSGTSKWVPEAPSGGGGGGWTLKTNMPLNGSLTGITAMSGTWVTGTGCIQQTDTSASQRRARTTTDRGGAVTAVEVEMRFDSGSGLRRFGLGLGAGAGSPVAYLTGDGASAWTVSTERDSTTGWTTGDAATYTAGNWVTFRILCTGTSIEVFVDGVWVASAEGALTESAKYPYMYTYQAAASFRNLKVWTLDGP